MGVFQMVSPPRGYEDEDETKLQHGKILRQKVLEVAPGFVEALFKLMAQVPTRYVQESIPCLIELFVMLFLKSLCLGLRCRFNTFLLRWHQSMSAENLAKCWCKVIQTRIMMPSKTFVTVVSKWLSEVVGK